MNPAAPLPPLTAPTATAAVSPVPGRAPVPGEVQPPTDARAIARALSVLPQVLALYETSPLHFVHPVNVLFDQLFPSLVNGQFRLLMKGGAPYAFVNWAWLSDEAAQRYVTLRHPVPASQWRSGPNLWCCEIVARPGAMGDLLMDLGRNVLARGTRLCWLRIGLSGELQGIGRFRIP